MSHALRPLYVVLSFFPMGNEERGGAAQGTILLLFLFTPHELVVQTISIMHCGPGLVSRAWV